MLNLGWLQYKLLRLGGRPRFEQEVRDRMSLWAFFCLLMVASVFGKGTVRLTFVLQAVCLQYCLLALGVFWYFEGLGAGVVSLDGRRRLFLSVAK